MTSKSDREYHLQLLARLLASLEAPEIVQAVDYEVDGHKGTMTSGGLVRLSSAQRSYLIKACKRAIAGHHDPLGLAGSVGGQTATQRLLDQAQQMHELVKGGLSQTAASQRIADALNAADPDRDSYHDPSGIRKNYREHRRMLEAGDRFYAARNAGEPFDDADLAVMLAGKVKGKRTV